MKRIPQLDGIRGIAILLVVIWHYVPCQVVAEPNTFSSFLNSALSLTWSGVDLFFVLSGFLIAGILLDQRNASNFFQVFYFRRACRILPIYFLLIILFVCSFAFLPFRSSSFDWLLHNPFPIWSYITFTQNILMGFRGDFGPHWLGITWSLAVEEQFYLFIPLIIYFLPRSTIFYCFLIAILIAPILRCVLPDFFAFVNMPSRADSLLSGGCLAILVRSPRFMATVKKHHQFLLPLFMTLLLGTAIMTFRRDTFGAFTHFWLAALYSVLILISLVYSDGVFSRILQSRVLVWFGTLSYGIYMFHEAVSGLLHGFLRGGAPSIKTLSDAGITVLAFLLTLALAALSYRFLESPFLAISHRFRYTRRLSLQEAVK